MPACVNPASVMTAIPGAGDGNRTRELSFEGSATLRPRALLAPFPHSLRAHPLVAGEPILWSGRRESNPRPTAWKAVTLPLSYSRPRNPAFILQLAAASQNPK